jgi:DNA-binding LytR/AlgR family response regulator
VRLLLIEDEAPAAAQLRGFAARYGLPTHDVHEVRSVKKGLAWFAGHEMPALIFSDIELLDGNVFGLFAQVRITCPIIFTTAYDQFLLAAFQANGIAYLLKPFGYEQFAAALAKYEGLRASFAPGPAATAAEVPAPGLSAAVVEQLRAALLPPAASYRQRFTVRQPNNSFYLLPAADVAFLQADAGVVFAIDQRGARHALAGTLTEWEQQLDPACFFRLNRSELVQLSAIVRAEPYFNNRLLVSLRHGATLTSSTAHTAAFRRWLEG